MNTLRRIRSNAKILSSFGFLVCLVLLSSFSFATTETITYTYDNAGELTTAVFGGEATVQYNYDSSGNRQSQTVSFTQPGISLSPISLNFGPIALGSVSTAQNITVTNTGTGPLTIESMSIIGANAAEFSTQSNTCSGIVLAPNGTCTVGAVFSPAALAAPETASLQIVSDAPGSPTVSASLSGNLEMTPPTVTAFTVPATSTSLTVPITSFIATDNIGVTGYIITESATAPAATASGWSATAPTSYTAAAAGVQSLYAYAEDAAGYVSTGVSASVIIETTPPTVTVFTVPTTSASLTVPITSFTATDSVGVTGYIVTESATTPAATASGWSATAPTSYTAAAAGAQTLYAYAKDAAGNVSTGVSASVVIWTPCASPMISVEPSGYETTTIQDGINNAVISNSVIEANSDTYFQNIMFSNNVPITLQGGYDCSLGNIVGYTEINGQVIFNASAGVVIQKVIIAP